jgi:hypothetical protein
MTEKILSQAIAWGFLCKIDWSGSWLIQPQHETCRWLLQQVGERWVLVVGNVPQINFWTEEALTFLEWRREKPE